MKAALLVLILITTGCTSSPKFEDSVEINEAYYPRGTMGSPDFYFQEPDDIPLQFKRVRTK